MHHILTITDYEDGRECEVEHLTSCPTKMHHHGYMVWSCQEGWYLDEFGLPDHLTVLPAGEYPVQFWVESRPNYTGVVEHEYGLDLVTE